MLSKVYQGGKCDTKTTLRYINDPDFREEFDKIYDKWMTSFTRTRDCDITDVSILRGAHTVNLSGCVKITDVLALGGVTTLVYPCWSVV